MRRIEAVLFASASPVAREDLARVVGQGVSIDLLIEDIGIALSDRPYEITRVSTGWMMRTRPAYGYEFDSLDAAVRDVTQTPRGRLRLTAPLTFSELELTPILNDFALRWPEIALDVSFSDRMVNLVDEGFDMAIRVGRSEDSRMIARKRCEVRTITVAAPDWLAEHGEPRVPQEVTGHSCILDTNFRDPERWPFDVDGKAVFVPVRGRLRYSNALACLSAAEAGLGLACMPSFVAGDALRAGRVRQVLGAFEPDPSAVNALYPHSRHLAAKVRVLVDFLAERYRGTPPWDVGW